MNPRLLMVAAPAAAFALGCGEQPPHVSPGPTAPLAEVMALTTVPPCEFTAMNPLVARYFPAAESQVVRQLIDAMAAEGAGSGVARNKGFDVMERIAVHVGSGTGGPPVDAAALTNELIKCMAGSVDELPELFPEDFSVAVTTMLPGAYAVRARSGVSPDTGAVVSRDGFSGVAPPFGVSWQTTLTGNAFPNRVLLYGRPGVTPGSYDWKAFPRNTVFHPEVIVGLCVDADAALTSLIHEEHVGILEFGDAYFLDLSRCPSMALGSSGFEGLLARLAGALFLPRSLSAAALLNPGGVGGLAGGLRSEFNERDVPTASLQFVVQPRDNVVSGTLFPPVEVQALSPAGEGVGGVAIRLDAVNNNGQTVQLQGTVPQVTGPDGIAVFADLSLTKTGGYRLVASGDVLRRDAIDVADATSRKFNIRPAK